MRRAPMHRFVARKPAASQFAIGKVGMLLPALMVAALVAPSARAIDLGVKTGAGAAVQAGRINADVSAAAGARTTTGAAREVARVPLAKSATRREKLSGTPVTTRRR